MSPLAGLSRDGGPDFFVTRNNARALAGSVGNPTAIGGRVIAGFADDSTQTTEIGAGSVTHRQSTATCFAGYQQFNPLRRVSGRRPSGTATSSDVPAGANVCTLPASPP